ncbi:immunoglobulin domain-containing protein [bacterium]|nr:immunoglobulin domain-containing protein [bacterium]
MDRDLKKKVAAFCVRFQVSVYALVILLSRAPVFKVLLERNSNLLPRASFLLKWVSGTATVVGGMNAVTGATASVKLLEGYGDTTAYVGEYFRLSFASSDYVVKSYRLGGAAPDGLSLSPIVSEFGVGTIDGIPTKKGVHNLDIWAYEEKGHQGDSTLLAITFYIREKGPTITAQPQGVSAAWGAAFDLEVALQDENGASFQWRKNGLEIPGATSTTLVISQAISMDEGVYDVLVSKDGDTLSSDPASVTVASSGVQRWKEVAFENPFSEETDAQLDPDLDGLINLIEYAIGSDPTSPTAIQLPQFGFQQILSNEYVVYSYLKNPNAVDISISAEYTDDLASPTWIPITDFLNGIRIENTGDSFLVKVPCETACFVRFIIAES